LKTSLTIPKGGKSPAMVTVQNVISSNPMCFAQVRADGRIASRRLNNWLAAEFKS
jgi:hypothetical protein